MTAQEIKQYNEEKLKQFKTIFNNTWKSQMPINWNSLDVKKAFEFVSLIDWHWSKQELTSVKTEDQAYAKLGIFKVNMIVTIGDQEQVITKAMTPEEYKYYLWFRKVRLGL